MNGAAGVAMPINAAAEPSCSAVPADGGFLSQPWTDHTARWACRRHKASVIVISAYGDIDAANAATLREYPLRCVGRCRGLILDLRGVEFFGTEGFSALHGLFVGCVGTGTGWAVVPGAAVTRVLQICDPQGSLPTARTVEAAAATFADMPLRPPQPFLSRTPSVRCERDACAVCGGRPRSAAKTGS
jgi:anti-anti-sigma factor